VHRQSTLMKCPSACIVSPGLNTITTSAARKYRSTKISGARIAPLSCCTASLCKPQAVWRRS